MNFQLASGLTALCIAAIGWIGIRNVPFQPVGAGLGPAFFPIILIGSLAILGLANSAVGFYKLKQGTDEKLEPFNPTALILGALSVAYGLLLAPLGFVVTTLAFLAASMIVLRARWKTVVALSLLATVGIYLLFTIAFRVRLP